MPSPSNFLFPTHLRNIFPVLFQCYIHRIGPALMTTANNTRVKDVKKRAPETHEGT